MEFNIMDKESIIPKIQVLRGGEKK